MKMSLLRSVSCPAPLYPELQTTSPAELAEQRGKEPKGSCCSGPCQGAGGTGETGLLEWEEQQPQAGRQLQLSRGRGEHRILEAVPSPMWKANNQVNKVRVGGRVPSLGAQQVCPDQEKHRAHCGTGPSVTFLSCGVHHAERLEGSSDQTLLPVPLNCCSDSLAID